MSKAKEVSRVVSSSISKSSETCWMCWKSDMLPPAPMTVYEPMGCIYCMSLKRASEPYGAKRRKLKFTEALQDNGGLTKGISRQRQCHCAHNPPQAPTYCVRFLRLPLYKLCCCPVVDDAVFHWTCRRHRRRAGKDKRRQGIS